MSLEWISLILIGGLGLLLAAGQEIFVGIGIIASIGLLFFVDKPVTQLAFSAWEIGSMYTLAPLPLFVFMGALLGSTGVVRGLFSGADKLFGRLPGGIACSVIAANAVFGAMCGSSIAATATFGKITFPEMERLGYEPKLALGSLIAGGLLSILIPPSFVLLVYGGWLNLSIARLFAAGMIPGIVLTLLFMATVIILVKLNPRLAPRAVAVKRGEKIIALKEILPFLILIFLILGVIFLGVMTPTESSALGAFLTIVLAIVYRKMTFRAFKEAATSSVTITVMVVFVMFVARVLGLVFHHLGVTEAFSAYMLNLPLGKYEMFALICVLYIFLGCLLDSTSMLVLTAPFVTPLIIQLGFDPIWFGVIWVILAEIGLVTPPFGMSLFALHGVIPKYSIITIFRGSIIFLVPMFLLVVLLVLYPNLALWFPALLFR